MHQNEPIQFMVQNHSPPPNIPHQSHYGHFGPLNNAKKVNQRAWASILRLNSRRAKNPKINK